MITGKISIALPAGYTGRTADFRLMPYLDSSFTPAGTVITTGFVELNGQYLIEASLPSTTQYIQLILRNTAHTANEIIFPIVPIESVIVYNPEVNGLVYQPTIAVTPNDSTDLSTSPTIQQGFFAITAGTIHIKDSVGNISTITVTEFQVVETLITRIYATGTTATQIYLIYDAG